LHKQSVRCAARQRVAGSARCRQVVDAGTCVSAARRCRTRLWSRDYGAAINIASNLRYFLLNASWDPLFSLAQDERAEPVVAAAAAAHGPARSDDRVTRDAKRQRKSG
jgi:hypothetical protein